MKKGIINILIYIFFPSFLMAFISPFVAKSKLLFITNVVSNILLTIFFIIKYRSILKEYLKNFKLKYIYIILAYWVIGFLLMIISNYIINYLIFNNGISNNELANREILYNNKIIYSFTLAVLIPFVEEICFRLEFKRNLNSNKFIIISSLLFALAHLLSISKIIEIIYIIPYFILGLTFSLIYNKTDNIISNIIAHMFHNLITVTILLI